VGLAAFWPILVIFFFNPSWLPILLKILLFSKFFDFVKGVKKNFFFDFLEVGNIFVNKKGANYELMAKSQFSFNSNGYFFKKLQKSASHFLWFFLISSKVLDRNL